MCEVNHNMEGEAIGYLLYSNNMWEAQENLSAAYSCTSNKKGTDGESEFDITKITNGKIDDESLFECGISKDLKSDEVNHDGRGVYKCDICSKELSRKAYLTRHMRRHTGENLHKCNLCDKTYAQKSNLTRHIRNVHKMEPQLHDSMSSAVMSGQCNNINIKYGCNEEYLLPLEEEEEDKSEFDEYLSSLEEEDDDKSEFDFTYIGEKIQSDYGLGTDLNLHNITPLDLLGRQCNSINSSEDFLVPREETEKSEFEVIDAGQQNQLGYGTSSDLFKSGDNVGECIVTDTGKIFYKCDICEKELSTKSSLKVHMKRHSSDNLHKCTLCDKQFTQKCSVGRHMRRVHKIDPGLFDGTSSGHVGRHYDYLNVGYGSPEDLVSSMDIEEEKNEFGHTMGNTGHQSLLQWSGDNLGQDIYMETSKMFYKCHICGKELTTKAILNGHVRRHVDGQIHKCVLCDKTYADKASLKRHIKSVHKIDPMLHDVLSEQDGCSEDAVLPTEDEKADTQVYWEKWWNNTGFTESIAF